MWVLFSTAIAARTAVAQRFTDITAQSGLETVRNARPDDWWASGLHFVDLDGDGHLDVFVSSHGSYGALAALGDGTGAFVPSPGSYPQSEIHIAYDIDEDGKTDLSMTHEDGGGRWWTNASTRGSLSFVGTSIQRGGNTSRVQVVFDVDGDGKVDWVRASENEGGVIVDRGDGHGQFAQGATQFPGLGNVNPIPVDIDADGDKDWLTSYGDYRYEPGRTNLYREEGQLALADVTVSGGLYVDGLATQGVGDFDNDGDSDFIAIEHENFPPSIFLNDGAGHFEKLEGAVTGVTGAPVYPTWGLGVVTDLDNDGIADVLFGGKIFLHVLHGKGGGRFEYVNDAWGIKNFAEASVDSGFAFGDVDGDGDLDLLSWRQSDPKHLFTLYRNDLPPQRWIRVRPVGLAGNHGASGAKIRVYAAGTSDLLWYEEVSIYCRQAQPSYGYHWPDTERHFGLGSRTKVDVTVEFHPSHKLVRKDGVDAGTTLRIGEDGEGTIVTFPPAGSGGRDGGAAPDSGMAPGGSGGSPAASGGQAARTGGAPSAGGAGLGSGGSGNGPGGRPSSDAGQAIGRSDRSDDEGCGCRMERTTERGDAGRMGLAALIGLAALARRRVRRRANVVRAAAASSLVALAVGCGSSEPAPATTPDAGSTGGASGGRTASGGSGGVITSTGGRASASGGTASTGGTAAGGTATGGSATGGTATGGSSGGSGPASTVSVHLIPEDGVSGSQRVNFAVPVAAGQLMDANRVRVLDGDEELAAGSRSLAVHPDGSVRSVQLQVQLELAGEHDIVVRLGETRTAQPLPLVPVETTLVAPNGEKGPRVWAVLPADRLSQSGIGGPLVPEAEVSSTPSRAWAELCDYDRHGLSAFLAAGYETDRAVWLFDRGTALYRGYFRRGELGPLRSAYVETSIYRNRITGSGTATRNGVPPDGAEDVKYAYSQNLALHYLLTGDDRFRESAEGIALGMSELWASPGYAGGSDFWTERHAGFGLLAYVWAMIVSDDRAAEFEALADAAVDAYLSMQGTYPPGYADNEARCFAHTADAHGESGDYFGCSPWMSAILGDALDQYARERDAARADKVRASLVQLGRIIARRGIQPDGRPYYFMGVGTSENMLDEYDEHFGESAYLIAMAWHYSGRADAALRSAADALVASLGSDGTAPHLRSFNWQCRSAVAAPWFLR